MGTDGDDRNVALQPLDALIGTWRLEASFPRAPSAEAAGADDVTASTVFEWALGGQFVIQRTSAPHPAPDSLALISVDPESERYTQHYYDSRGVVRVYAMTFIKGVWTLLRDASDFSPLDFSQRFTGTFNRDGTAILGRWETSPDGMNWDLDFELTYSRVII